MARRPGGDRAAFILALAGSLVLTPIVWPHYLAVLCVALALARPRVGVAWVAPMALWFAVPAWSGGNPVRIAIVLAVVLGLFGWAVWRTLAARTRASPVATAEPRARNQVGGRRPTTPV